MKRFLRWAAYVIGAGMLALASCFLWLTMTAVHAADLPPLKNGDIVFQYSGSGQSLPILLASRSPYTHMGLIEFDNSGKPSVVEAVGPVQTIPLDRWIDRGFGKRIDVYRVKGLSETAAQLALKAAHVYDGLPYDIFFLDDKERIYCSELVHLAYAEGPGLTLGKVPKVKELDLDYAPVRNLIERRWNKHPMCSDGKATSFEACYAIILEQELITPSRIAEDEQLERVFSNFGVAD